MISKNTFLFSAFLVPILLFGQHSSLSRFHAQVVESTVHLEWTMIAGQTCQGTVIERSDGEGGAFVEIGTIEGICGNVTEAEDYSFTDSNPISGRYNEYRLELGGQGRTLTVKVLFHDLKGFEVLVLQNVSAESITLVPSSTSSETTEVEVFDTNGSKVDSFYLYSEGETEHSVAHLNKGLYVIRVIRGNQAIHSDRFVKFF